MIIKDMKNAGFVAKIKNALSCQVGLNRPVSTMEVETAMIDCGYHSCQYKINKNNDTVTITVL